MLEGLWEGQSRQRDQQAQSLGESVPSVCAQTAPGRKQSSLGTQWAVFNRVRMDTTWPKGQGWQEKWHCRSGSWCSGAILSFRLWAVR